jgi:hypothetical protein
MNADQFAGHIDEDDRGYVADLTSPSDRLLVAFAGLGGRKKQTPFQFFRIANQVETKRLFVRDLETVGYQRGIRGLGDDVRSAADGLGELIAKLDVSRVVFAGNSLGAFGAQLYGSLLNVDRILAFAPQTTYARSDRWRGRDRRWPNECRGARKVDGAILDVRPLIAQTSAKVDVYYDATFRLDRFHAERIASLPNVTATNVPGAGHRVTRMLRDSGRLTDILNEALAAPS